MKSQANQIRLQFSANMKPEIIVTLTSRDGLESLNDLKAATDKGKTLDVEIKPHRERRSLDANGLLWVMLGKIAEALRTDKDAVYLKMLKRYGQYTYVIAKPEAVEKLKQSWRLVEEVGKTKNGDGVQLLCYFGSSLYDKREMSVLIDGTVSEAKELGIETMTPRELALIKDAWGGD